MGVDGEVAGWRTVWDTVEAQLASLPSAVVVLDRESLVVHATRRLASWAPADLVGRPFTALIAKPEQRGHVERAVSDVLRGGSAVTDAQLAEPPEPTWARFTIAPLRGPHGVVGAFVLAEDITDRKREEARLRQRERLLADTQGVAHMGVWEWDPSQPTADWSEQLYRIYGLDPSEHSPTYEDYLTRVHPDDRERVARATEGVFLNHEPYSHDERVFRPDGEMRYLHTWAEPILDPQNKLLRLMGVCQDITDRKVAELKLAESEAQLRAIFQHAPVGMASVDRAARIVQANPALERMLGLKGSSLGLSLAELLDEEDREPYAPILTSAIESGEPCPPMQLRLRSPRGPVWVRMTIRPTSAQGAPPPAAMAAVVLVQDISIQQRAEEADAIASIRLLRIQELEKISEWKSTLLHVASHEIRNPLSPMLLLLDHLQAGGYGPLAPKQADALGLVAQQAQRISYLIRDIVDAALIEQGRLHVARRAVDIAPLVHRVTETFRPLAGRWDVRLEQELDAPLRACADPDRLEQVVVNLLSNALKFTPEGGRVRVGAAHEDGKVVVSVSDSGPGLDDAARAGLFRAFTEPREPGHGAPAGSGLGLFISKSLVEAHGGDLWVESEPGAGATFFFSVPEEAVAGA